MGTSTTKKDDDDQIHLVGSQILNIDLTSIVTTKEGQSHRQMSTIPSVDTLDSREFASFRYTDASARQGTIDKENDLMDSTLDIKDLAPMLPKPKKKVVKPKLEERKSQRSASRSKALPRKSSQVKTGSLSKRSQSKTKDKILVVPVLKENTL